MTKHHDLLTADPTDLYDDLTRPFIPARLHLDAARRHIMARPSLVETADKLDATQQLVDELNERLAAARETSRELASILAQVGELLGVPDWTPYHARETVKAARAVVAENERLREELAAVELKHRYAVHVVKGQAVHIDSQHSRCGLLRAALIEIISRPGEAEQVARLAVMEDGQS